jgi:hypothetical protein
MDCLYFIREGSESANCEPQQSEKILLNFILTSQRGASRVGDGTSIFDATLKIGSDMGGAGTKGLLAIDPPKNKS